jgi:protein SCO1/2
MGDVARSLARNGIGISPVMITVDPARDTVDNMAAPLAEFHPDFIGLTGDAAALGSAYKAFSVEHALAYEDPDYGPVYTHGSLIYLMDGSGEVLTLIPPVMDAHRAAQVAMKYLAGE